MSDAAPLRYAAVGTVLVATAALLMSCSSKPAPEMSAGRETDLSTPVASGTPESPRVRPSARDSAPEQTAVPVFFVDQRGGLVARTVMVDAYPDRILAALTLAGRGAPDSELEPAFPSAAFASVSFDGVGVDGQYGVRLTDRTVRDPSPGMTPVQARIAIRAAVCTVQGSGGAAAEVVFYLGRLPVDRIFGQALPGGAVRDGDCPR